MAEIACPFVSRGGLKLAGALDAFGLSPAGWVCADLGCSTGGFTDCLLQRGAERVYAVDTAYGQFAWKLRNDPRVTLQERTNALHFDPAKLEGFAGVDLVVIDLGWTKQKLALPAAIKWLRPLPLPLSGGGEGGGEGAVEPRIITLIKPQYEADPQQVRGKRGGILDDAELGPILEKVMNEIVGLGLEVMGCVPAAIRGSAAGGKPGNQEYLAMVRVLKKA